MRGMEKKEGIPHLNRKTHFTVFPEILFLSFIILTLFPINCLSFDCKDSLEASGLLIEEAISDLQDKSVQGNSGFAVASDFKCLIDSQGGGPCASVTAFNAIQSLRRMNGETESLLPHKVILQTYSYLPELLKGRVSNQLLLEAFKFYQGRYLPNLDPDISIEVSPNSIDQSEASATKWNTNKGPNLDITDGELKILIYQVYDPDEGYLIGRHFVLLKKRESETSVTIVDPNKPTEDYTYVIKKESDLDTTNFMLERPGSVASAQYKYTLDTVFTLSLLNETQTTETKELSVESAKLAISHIAKELKDSQDFTSPTKWRELGAEYGLPALDLPNEYGGANFSAKDMLPLFEHAGEYDLNLRDVLGGAHVRPLLSSNHPEHQEIIRKVAHGDAYIAIAITERAQGSHMRAMNSVSQKVPGGYVISGSKFYNARFSQASHVIIFTQAPNQTSGKLNTFILPMDYPGLRVQQLNAPGLNGNSFGGLAFDSLFIPDSFLIGEDGMGGKLFREHFLYWRLMQSAAAIGTAKGALKQMAERLKTRLAFGGPIGRFTHLQQQLAEHTGKLEMALALARNAADLIDSGKIIEATPLVSMVKAEGVEAAWKATEDAVKAFGAEGYTDNTDLFQRMNDIFGLRIADGTTDVMRSDVVRRVYGQEFWDMLTGESK